MLVIDMCLLIKFKTNSIDHHCKTSVRIVNQLWKNPKFLNVMQGVQTFYWCPNQIQQLVEFQFTILNCLTFLVAQCHVSEMLSPDPHFGGSNEAVQTKWKCWNCENINHGVKYCIIFKKYECFWKKIPKKKCRQSGLHLIVYKIQKILGFFRSRY